MKTIQMEIERAIRVLRAGCMSKLNTFNRPFNMLRGSLRNPFTHSRPLYCELSRRHGGISPQTISFLKSQGYEAVYLSDQQLDRLPDIDIFEIENLASS